MGKEPDVLVFTAESAPDGGLPRRLREFGFAVDGATSVAEAQSLFLHRGGHALLVIGPCVCTGRAREVIRALRNVDDDLEIVVFGDEVVRGESFPHLHRIRSFHPVSRAGVGAIRKILCGLSRA